MGDYPRVDDTERPFRIWDAKAKEALRWRYYAHLRNAHLGALVECRWAEVGTVLEVYNVLTGKLMGQYRRGLHDIKFTGE